MTDFLTMPRLKERSAMFSNRQLKLYSLRSLWAIKQQQAAQLSSAIEVLANGNIEDDAALSVAEKILNANAGP